MKFIRVLDLDQDIEDFSKTIYDWEKGINNKYSDVVDKGYEKEALEKQIEKADDFRHDKSFRNQ